MIIKSKLQHFKLKGKIATIEDRVIIAKAAKYYAKKLLSRQMQPHVSIIIQLKPTMKNDYEGWCEIIGYGRKNAPRHFLIKVIYDREKLGLRKTLRNLAHEMVHARQFAYKMVDPDLTTWNGEKIPEDTNYWEHPWEIDAYGRETGLYTRFCNKNNITSERLDPVKNDQKDHHSPGTAVHSTSK